MLPTYFVFKLLLYCCSVILLESKWDAYLKEFCKAEWHCKLQFNLDLVKWVMGTHLYFILQPLLALQMYFLVQLYWWSLSIFFRIDAICWLFWMVSFGFHALWISEISLVLFLKISLFAVSFVLYNCTLWFRKTHGSVKTSSLKEKAMEVVAVLTKVKRVPWNYIQPVDPYLGDEQTNLKNVISMVNFWFFRNLQLHVTEASRVLVSLVLSVNLLGWQLATLDEEPPQLPESLVIFLTEERFPQSGRIPGAVNGHLLIMKI